VAPKLTPLPNLFTYECGAPGGADTLLFPIYGDATLIKVVRIPVDHDLHKGARIILTVEIDAGQRITCRGTIPDAATEKTFAFAVESPVVALPTLDEFRTLDAQAHAVLAQYPGKDRGMRSVTVDRLCREIRRAFEQRDIAKAIQRMGELREIVDELDPAKWRVQPPIEDLDELVSQCAAILQVLPEQSTIKRQEISEDVAKNATAAHEAAEHVPPDQPLYSRCFENIRNYHKTLVAEYQRFDTTTPEDEALGYIKWANELYAQAVNLPLSAHEQGLVKEARGKIDAAQALLDKGKARQATQAAAEAGQNLKQIVKRKMPSDQQTGKEGELVDPLAKRLREGTR
jgi:hypothetical protein